MANFLNDCDDPYVLCVYHLLSQHSRAEIKRMLEDNEYVKNLILKETRDTDFRGAFIDTIVQGILEDKRRMEFMGELDKLSDYFYDNFNISRFRKTLKKAIKKYDFFDLYD